MLRRVLPAHLHQLVLLPPLGHVELHLPAPALGEPLGHQLPVLHRAVQGDDGRDPVPDGVVLAQKLRPGLRVGLAALGEEALPVAELAPLEPEHLEGGVGLPLGQGEHVLLLDFAGHHLLALLHLVDGGDAVPQPGGQLELHVFGGLLHFGGEGLDRGGAAALDEVQGLLEGLVVLGLADTAPAGGAALLDVVVEAGPALAEILGKFAGAVGELEDLPGGVDGLLDGPGAQVGADVPGAVVLHLFYLGDAGPGAAAYPDVAVALVVL